MQLEGLLKSMCGRAAGLRSAVHFSTSFALSDLKIVSHGNADMVASQRFVFGS
jgi:hypothetical protein